MIRMVAIKYDDDDDDDDKVIMTTTTVATTNMMMPTIAFFPLCSFPNRAAEKGRRMLIKVRTLLEITFSFLLVMNAHNVLFILFLSVHVDACCFCLRFNATNPPAFLENRFRFMFVRDPYSRLWSAYVDKFLLPNFWKMYGWRIVQRRPWNHTADERCARNISFSEFLDYVTSTAPGSLNEHFAPYRLLCSPCVFRPHVIGKMETFGEDARYVLQQLNLSRFASEFSSYDKHARHEMTMLIDDVYLVYEESFFKFCTNTTDLAARLWQVLQINGYLPSDIAFPWNKNKHVNKHALKELVLEVYSSHPNRDEHVQKIQKEQSLVNGYRTVPDDILAKVRELYALEFKMFDYDPFPEKLYGYRNTSMTNLDFPFRE